MKKAIILAGGLGSRLRPITEHKPKTLVQVNGKPMLGYIIDALLANKLTDIVIVCGYLGESIQTYCESAYPGHSFTYITDTEYDHANNLHGLYLSRKHFTEDVLIMNGDLVFDPSVIKALKGSPSSSIAVDAGRYMEESMKVVVKGGRIQSISKKITEQDAHGCSIDVYKFVRRDLPALRSELERTVKSGNVHEWTEAALDRLFAAKKIQPRVTPIGRARWAEIDNLIDLGDAELLFNDHLSEFAHKKIFFIDNDGTLSLSGKALPGSNEFLAALKKAKKTVYVLTNNSSRTPEDIAVQLKKQGLGVAPNQVLISTQSAMAFFKEQKIKRLFWAANPKAGTWLKKSGFTFDRKNPEALLLCYDTSFTYPKLEEFIRLVRKGVPYYATHIDKLCPTDEGPVPDIGLFIDMIEAATGKRPLKTFGKPDKDFILPVLKSHKLSPKDAVVIGDRLYTDIAMAHDSGALSVLVLSGEVKRHDYEFSPENADIVVSDVSKLTSALSSKRSSHGK